MTKKELQDLIEKVTGTVVASSLETALAPLREQQTDWMKQIQKAAAAPRKVEEHLKGIGAARFVRALAAGRGDPSRAAHFAEKAWDDELGTAVAKSLTAGDFDAGGFLIPPEFVPEVIELLRSAAVVRRALPRILPMASGTLTLRKQTSGTNAAYVGESTNIATSQPAGGHIQLTAKKLAAIVPISNDLLSFTNSPSADEFVRDELVQDLAVREDLAFIRDDGTQDTPKGMRFWADPANVTASNGTSATNIEDDFKDLVNALETKDVQMIRPAWFMNPRSKNHLRNLRDANGNLIFPEIRNATPTLYGWPVMSTTNIPINLGGGTETEVYLADMFHAVIGEASTLQIAVDSSASYIESATLVSAFARDETLMRAISRHDFAMRHAEAVAVKNVIVWGA